MRWVLVILFWGWAVGAQAGAWPRGEGKVFAALSFDANRSQLYAEYGIRGDWTLGMEVSMPKDRRLPDYTQFIHYPVWRSKGGAILSAGLAVEMRETTAAAVIPALRGESEIAGRAGLFWGKGFNTPIGGGWATVDAQLEKLVTTDWLENGMTYKLDAGFGVKPIERLSIMAQAQYWQRGDDQSLRVEGAAAWKTGFAQVVISPSVGVIGEKDPLVKLGLWVDF